MDRLIQGYRSFRQNVWPEQRTIHGSLGRGQKPRNMVIACSDSRVDPALLFGTDLGDVFVVRNVANLVPPYNPDSNYHGTSAALEFGVTVLKVEHLIVLGHSQCGGIRALVENETNEARDFVSGWMQIAEPARERACCEGGSDAEIRRRCEFESIKQSLENLRSFPWIRAREAAGDLQLHGWYFDVETGDLLTLGVDGAFQTVR